MTDFHIRITCAHDHPSVQQMLSRSEGPYCVGYETGDKTGKEHVHMIIRTSKTSQTLRNWLKADGFSGNGQFSVSQAKDRVKLLAYCLKSGRFLQKGYDDLLPEAIQYDEKIKRDKSTGCGVVDTIVDGLRKSGVTGQEPTVESVITKAVVRYYLDQGKFIRRNQVEAVSLTVLAKLHPERFMAGIDQWAAKIFEFF